MNEIAELSYALDTFYFLVSGVLVMWMAAGFTMLEAGLVRSKNTVEILTKNVALFAVACLMYMLTGYGIMYGASDSAWLPAFDGLLSSIDNTATAVVAGGDDAPYYSRLSDFFFQVVFVATAMSVVSGAVAERMKLTSFLLFAVVLTGFIYPVQGFWKWGGGWLEQQGFVDFAGSGIVHMCGATAALTGVLLLGPRRGKYSKGGRINAMPGANLPLAAIGTLILWMGWFGFNGGSQLKLSDVENANAVSMIFVNTNMAAVGGVIMTVLIEKFRYRKVDLTMVLNGALAGLVAITASPNTSTPLVATLVGAVGGMLVILSIVTLDKLRIDDPVGAISVHGVVGIWGLLVVPLTNQDATLIGQLKGVLVIGGWVAVTSFAVWFILSKTVGIRISQEAEYEGGDMAECGVSAYPEFVAGQ